MRFKTPETEAEFRDTRLKSDVKALLFMAIGYAAVNWPEVKVEVTDVYYEKGKFNSTSSTHEEWRAIDLVLRNGTDAQSRELGEWLNSIAMLSAPGMKPVVYHDTGYGLHLHLQTSRLGRITIVRQEVDSLDAQIA